MAGEQPARVAFFIPGLREGGAQRTILDLAGGFLARGYLVDLLVAAMVGPYVADVPTGVTVRTLGTRGTAAAIPAFVRYLRRHRPQVLLSALTHGNIVALVAKQLSCTGRATRTYVGEHGPIERTIAGFGPLSRHAARLLVSALYPRSNGVLAVSEGLRSDLLARLSLPSRLVASIPNPVDIDRVVAEAKQEVDHSVFRSGKPLIVGCGRLTRQKDFPTLLRAFALVARSRPVQLAILGDGEDRESLNGLAEALGRSRDVHLLGHQRNPHAFMGRASAFVLSSAWEGFGNVLIEALALGVPVVSTDCPFGPSEILDGGRYGRLVPVGDKAGLAEAIVATLDERPNPEQLRRRAEAYSVDTIVNRYEELFFAGRG